MSFDFAFSRNRVNEIKKRIFKIQSISFRYTVRQQEQYELYTLFYKPVCHVYDKLEFQNRWKPILIFVSVIQQHSRIFSITMN